jgi:tRNA dimethylallyltransferase
MKNIKVVVIIGPTATGKTSLAVKLAKEFAGEIISADSRQVYKGLDIGTGKDIKEYGTGSNAVKYHLIDICSPKETYNLKQFNNNAKELINEIYVKNKLPIIAGGTALYVDSLVSNYDFPISAPNLDLRTELKTKSIQELADYLRTYHPDRYKKLDNKNSRPRIVRAIENKTFYNKKMTTKSVLKQSQASKGNSDINFQWLIIGTFFSRKEVHSRIEKRLEDRLSCGMIEEVQSLHKNGISWERLDAFGLEYRYISQYLKNEINLGEMKNILLAKIRRLARSQDIWFRKMEQKGHKIYWIPEGIIRQASVLVKKFINNKILPEPDIKLMNIYYGPKS